MVHNNRTSHQGEPQVAWVGPGLLRVRQEQRLEAGKPFVLRANDALYLGAVVSTLPDGGIVKVDEVCSSLREIQDHFSSIRLTAPAKPAEGEV